MKTIAVALLFAAAVASVSCGGSKVCSCPAVITGMALVSAEPVTAVQLSGSACQGGTFSCGPAGASNAITTDCTHVQVNAKAVGLCVVDVTAGSMTFHLEREMVFHNYGCCGTSIGERYPQGEIDVRTGIDGGSDAASN